MKLTQEQVEKVVRVAMEQSIKDNLSPATLEETLILDAFYEVLEYYSSPKQYDKAMKRLGQW